MATQISVSQVFDEITDFLAVHGDDWDHAAWEALVASMANQGLEPSDEMRRNLGNILEASKFFLGQMPAKPAKAKSRAKAKPKAKAKAKPRAKAKPESAS